MLLFAIFISLAAGLSACRGDSGLSQVNQAGGGAVDKTQLSPTLALALTGLGGVEALTTMNTFVIEAEGKTWHLWKNETPDSAPKQTSAFSVRVSHNIVTDQLHLAYERQVYGYDGLDRSDGDLNPGISLRYSYVIDQNLGYIEGRDRLIESAQVRAMGSDQVASVSRLHRFLTPQLLIRQALVQSDTVSEKGRVNLEGRPQQMLLIEDAVYPLTLYVDEISGTLTKLTTKENNHLGRDVPLEISYHDWRLVDGRGFPYKVEVRILNQLIYQETRTLIGTNKSFNPTLFYFPQQIRPIYDETLARLGATSALYHHLFAASGFPIAANQQTAHAVREIAKGIYHLIGDGGYHSLVVEQAERVVVVQAPLNEANSERIIGWVQTQFPDKPLTHLIQTHHHLDHAGGLRRLAAHGATLVAHEMATKFYRSVLAAPSQLAPDVLSSAPTSTSIEAVGVDGYRLADPIRPLIIYHVPSSYAADLVLIYLPQQRVLFADGETYKPGHTVGLAPNDLLDVINQNHLAPELIIAARGTSSSFDQLLQTVKEKP